MKLEKREEISFVDYVATGESVAQATLTGNVDFPRQGNRFHLQLLSFDSSHFPIQFALVLENLHLVEDRILHQKADLSKPHL